jgi:hypothetical protein
MSPGNNCRATRTVYSPPSSDAKNKTIQLSRHHHSSERSGPFWTTNVWSGLVDRQSEASASQSAQTMAASTTTGPLSRYTCGPHRADEPVAATVRRKWYERSPSERPRQPREGCSLQNSPLPLYPSRRHWKATQRIRGSLQHARCQSQLLP